MSKKEREIKREEGEEEGDCVQKETRRERTQTKEKEKTFA